MGVPLDHGSQMTSASKTNPTRSDRRGGPLTVLLPLLLIASPALADRTIEGRVTVVRDVDTIIVAGTAVRLNGVDGPETSTRYGREARAFMTRLVQGETVICDLNGERTYDRWVGVCFLDGEDIGAIAITNGFALDCRRYSGGAYRDLETREARSRLDRASYCK
jgi:micrococcal nuclease